MVEAAARAVKDCRVHWIPETIHDIGYHKPAELARLIREFLAAIIRPAPGPAHPENR